MTTSASREKKPREFWAVVFDEPDRGALRHIRVPNVRYFDITPIGTAAEMHGENGCCVCCYGRGAA